MAKITYRIPTSEQYAFVEVVDDGEPSLEEIRAKYDLLSDSFRVRPVNTLPDKEFDEFVENMLLGDGNQIENYEHMSPQQQKFIQVIKRALKRIAYKQNKQ